MADPSVRALQSAVARKVLYVEDNALVREITEELFSEDGRTVIAFENAEQALAAFAADPTYMVITDLSLPAMSGLDLARSIAAIDPHAVIIIASGYDLDFDLNQIGKNVRCVVKPFEALEVLALADSLGG